MGVLSRRLTCFRVFTFCYVCVLLTRFQVLIVNCRRYDLLIFLDFRSRSNLLKSLTQRIDIICFAGTILREEIEELDVLVRERERERATSSQGLIERQIKKDEGPCGVAEIFGLWKSTQLGHKWQQL